MRWFIVPLLAGFGVALAAVIGQRMSTDAMAVVLGVAVGVVASVPTTILLMAILRRALPARSVEPEPAYRPSHAPMTYPYSNPVGQPIIITMPTEAFRSQPQPPPAPLVMTGARDIAYREVG